MMKGMEEKITEESEREMMIEERERERRRGRRDKEVEGQLMIQDRFSVIAKRDNCQGT